MPVSDKNINQFESQKSPTKPHKNLRNFRFPGYNYQSTTSEKIIFHIINISSKSLIHHFQNFYTRRLAQRRSINKKMNISPYLR